MLAQTWLIASTADPPSSGSSAVVPPPLRPLDEDPAPDHWFGCVVEGILRFLNANEWHLEEDNWVFVAKCNDLVFSCV
jgi:hypothetical protein